MADVADPATRLPPLVEPVAELTAEQKTRYSRHILMPTIGELGQRRIRNARVLVVGAGGLGSPAVTYLAAAGVGTIGIVDADDVELSNLQRQVVHRTVDVGQPKVESAARVVAELNPDVVVRTHAVRLTAANAGELIAEYDIVLDGTDNFPTRYLLNDACVVADKPYVWGSILQFEGQVSVFWARHGPQYRDVYPHPPPEGSVPSCAQAGVLGALCATIGSLMVTEVVKLICGAGEPLLGRVLIYDALDQTWRTVRVRSHPQTPGRQELADASPGFPADDEPNQSADGMSPEQLQQALADASPPLLVDVRSQAERDIVSIGGAVAVPLAAIVSGTALDQLPRDRQIVLHCRTGGRSAQALNALRAAGFADATHLAGGILAWIDRIEPGLPQY